MMDHDDLSAFDSDLKTLFKKHAHGDFLLEYTLLASAMDPRDSQMYSTSISPFDQRPTITSGLVRMGMVTSDQMLSMAMEVYEDDEDDD